MDIQLKSIPPSQLPPSTPGCRSDELHRSEIPSNADPRHFYLDKVKAGDLEVPPPLISYSEFVPKKLVEHLMRKKKNSALGVKFIRLRSDSHRMEDITDMVRIGGALFFLFGNVSRGVTLEALSPLIFSSALETFLGRNNSKTLPEEVIANSPLTDRRVHCILLSHR
jgi:hypothetical protein